MVVVVPVVWCVLMGSIVSFELQNFVFMVGIILHAGWRKGMKITCDNL